MVREDGQRRWSEKMVREDGQRRRPEKRVREDGQSRGLYGGGCTNTHVLNDLLDRPSRYARDYYAPLYSSS